MRVQTAETPQAVQYTEVTGFVDYSVIDVDDININNMGCTWYFDAFDVTTERNYSFSFPNIDVSKQARMRASVASRNGGVAKFAFKYNGTQLYANSFGEFTPTI